MCLQSGWYKCERIFVRGFWTWHLCIIYPYSMCACVWRLEFLCQSVGIFISFFFVCFWANQYLCHMHWIDQNLTQLYITIPIETETECKWIQTERKKRKMIEWRLFKVKSIELWFGLSFNQTPNRIRSSFHWNRPIRLLSQLHTHTLTHVHTTKSSVCYAIYGDARA